MLASDDIKKYHYDGEKYIFLTYGNFVFPEIRPLPKPSPPPPDLDSINSRTSNIAEKVLYLIKKKKNEPLKVLIKKT